MRTLNLDRHADDPALVAFVLDLERDRRRVWPQFGKPYDEPAVTFGGAAWTVDQLAAHLRLDDGFNP